MSYRTNASKLLVGVGLIVVVVVVIRALSKRVGPIGTLITGSGLACTSRAS